MYRYTLFLATSLVLAVSAIKYVSAETQCTTDGWFGINCMYQCHCADFAPCDKVDGSCSKGCHQDWFGPACQYKSVSLSIIDWKLRDNDDSTCATKKYVNVQLNTPIPLTWIRLVGSQAENLKRMSFWYYLDDQNNNSAIECTSLHFAKVNNRTLDVECITNKTVKNLSITFQSDTSVCSLYVSGGRNLALKQSTNQSSRFNARGKMGKMWIASNAVDGQTGYTGKTCTHTADKQPGEVWWTVTFSKAADISSFTIFNRYRNCCKERLMYFTLAAYPEMEKYDEAVIRTYTDINTSPQKIYSWVPSPRIGYPVKEVRFTKGPKSKYLTLCEVYAFGETRCPANTFGLDCQGTCNCAQNKRCFVHSGGCPNGCAPGYTGEDCQKQCPNGKYGANCSSSCSQNCTRTNLVCNHITGKCESCPTGTYGFNCSELCSINCGGNGKCKRDNGYCASGCKPGFLGQQCEQKCNKNCNSGCKGGSGNCNSGCNPGFWGPKCQSKCSQNCNGRCQKKSGDCFSCKPGYYGTNCSSKCSENCGGKDKPCNSITGMCDSCRPGFHGGICSLNCSRNCFRSDNSCDRRTGACNEGCLPGYSLSKCKQECPAGKYGANCSNTCSQNCTKLNQICDHITGKCESCPTGTYGFNCSELCSTNCGGNGTCRRDDGYCEIGCKSGFWGQKCIQKCERNCGRKCNRNRGYCYSCKRGFWGSKCKRNCGNNCKGKCKKGNGDCFSCKPGYYGVRCLSNCSKNCGGEDKSCSFKTGMCNVCLPGFHGDFCKQNCSRNCLRSDNSCVQKTKSCEDGCTPGYKQPTCEQACDIGRYGKGCMKICSEHCGGEKNSCDHISGKCRLGCDPGYKGLLCEQECKETTWGQNCTQSCNRTCQNNTCHHVTGICDECLPGYLGDFCDQECNETTHGLNCAKSCDTNCLSSRCHHVTGKCYSCTVGKTGEFCHLLKQTEDESRNKMTFIIIGLVCLLVIIFLAVCVVAYRRIKNKDRADNGICLNELPDGSDQADLAPATTGRRTKEKRNVLTRVKLPLELSLRGAFNFGQERENAAPCRANATASTSQANPTEFENTAIPVGNLKNYILQHSNDTHFEEEFSSVPMRNGSLQTYGALPENAKKNRYKNIIPYDTNRVQLQAKQGKKNSDYINASYIKGHKSNRAFIASQGPNDAILHDFVRMLWEQKVEKVVMLTNLIEEGKKKCSMYWPTDGEEQFDEVAVRLLTTHVYAEYTIRNLRLSKSGESPRNLTQFHFTAWPDQSVPESPWGLVDLYQRVTALQGNGPVLVHCSAGVGRTGTFIALCNLLQEAEATGKMDFQSTLRGLRQDRMNTIQTLKQYSYLHRVALVGYMVADTTVSVAYLRCRMFILESEKGGTKSTCNYKQEFEAIVEACDATTGKQAEPLVEEKRKDVYQNLKDTNIASKDRLSNILPKPGYRPDLTAEIHYEDTYINAVLVPNLIKDRHDMLTQLPLPSTVTDFWRLVLQSNVSLVVAFDTDLKDTDETIGDFLPKSETEPFENERFIIKTEKPVEWRVVTEFSLTLQQKVMPDSDITTSQTKKLTLLLCKTVQMDPSSVLEIHEQIQAHKPLDSIRTVYMCRNGADKCGLMCIQSILLDRMKLDRCLTVPLVVGTIKAIRPQAIPTVEQYKCLYQVLRRAYETQNEYMNIEGASST